MRRIHEKTPQRATSSVPPLLTKDFSHPVFTSSIHQIHNGDVNVRPSFHSSEDMTSVIVPRTSTKLGKQPEVTTIKLVARI